jgi:ATP-dependent Lon protease
VGFKEFKKMIASFVRGYSRLTEKKIDKPCQMYLLLGPPGVGKSFISEMLAEAMGLDIEVISMNGKKETSIFFGVPQEWAGAGVGEILKTMIKYKTRAPIILLDEFEKCDKAVQQVLGNLTDETLNKKFKDVFFDFPIPINEVIFFCTANYPEDIEPFLLSRLTRVKIEPLTFAERIEVAQGLIDYNFAKYEISDLKDKFSYELIKKCLCKE